MARHKSYQSADEANPALDISSLIDVCFLLLIYFLVATTIQKKEMDIKMNLPVPVANPLPSEIEPLVITIHQNGMISTGTNASLMIMDTDPDSREVPVLSQFLKLYGQTQKTPVVQLHVENEAMQQRVMDVLNALVGAGIQHVAIADGAVEM